MSMKSNRMVICLVFSIFSCVYSQEQEPYRSSHNSGFNKLGIKNRLREDVNAPLFTGAVKTPMIPYDVEIDRQSLPAQWNENVKVIDLYLPGLSVSYESYRPLSRFEIEAGLYQEVIGPGLDEYRYSYITQRQDGNMDFYLWAKIESFGTHAGFALGAIYISSYGEGWLHFIPLTGFRVGDMKRFYLSIDAMLIVPVMFSLHGYIRYPYAQYWVGYLPGFIGTDDSQAAAGLEIPVIHRAMIKFQGIVDLHKNKEDASPYNGGLARIGIGLILNEIKEH